MMGFLSKIAGTLLPSGPRKARGKAGARAYAIGDIHGRLDLLDSLLGLIEEDIRSSPERANFLVFLGDLIDRGPESARVVERLRTYRPPDSRCIFLAGNHEEVMLRILAGDPDLLEDWLRFGGSECVASYGLDPGKLTSVSPATATELVRRAVPQEHVDFLSSFGDTFRFGDYLFVHAGVRPGVSLHEQTKRDLRWIREPFLSDTGEHEFLIVHGHTVVDVVEERANRICIDTGAVYSGKLTALVVEDDKRRYLVTEGRPWRRTDRA
jgi:serine/threonine protein phosphatase 1